MKRLWLLVLLLACERTPRTEPYRSCVASHDEAVTLPMTTVDGEGHVAVTMTTQWETVCDLSALFHPNGQEFPHSRRKGR